MGFGIGTARQILSTLFLIALLCNGVCGGYGSFNRRSFPEGFVFGTGSSAYQYEGAVKEGGRGPSMWDTFTHIPGKIADGGNGDVAVDFYHRYKEDLNLLKDMNMDAFRFSIAWGRILPTGSLSGGVNREGIEFYNKLINETIAKGLKPFVTLFHWDTPLALEKKYGGFLSENIVKDFRDYADVCFNEFGDRVKYWTTFNEPWTMCSYGYGSGAHAPGRCSPYVSKNCGAGDSSREPYTTAHHVLLAHGEAVRLYRQKYQVKQKGQIGITLVSHWFEPYGNTTADKFAVKRSLDFMFGWFMDPVVYGDYPRTMKGWLSNRLPSFTAEQSEMLKRSYDFVGVNYYTTYYVVSVVPPNGLQQAYSTDARANQTGYRNGVAIGPPAYTPFLFMYPPGMRELLLYTKKRYKNPIIYVTENGVDEGNNSTQPLEEALKDDTRISYHQSHLSFIHLAIKEGVNVKGYFSWTFMDCFEWGDGYKDRFGLIFVNHTTLERHRKKSSHWFENFLRK